MITRLLRVPFVGFSIVSLSACSVADRDAEGYPGSALANTTLAGNTAQRPNSAGDPYPLATCPVTGAKLGSMGDPVIVYAHERELRFCCEACPEEFEANSNFYRAKIDEVILEQQFSVYPTDDCIVSDRHLGSMGEPIEYVIGNRLVRMCCDCQETLKGDLDAIMGKLDGAVVRAQQANYPLDECIVSGEELGGAHGEMVGAVIANRLFQLCCKNCVEELREEPAKYIEILDSARSGPNFEGPASGFSDSRAPQGASE